MNGWLDDVLGGYLDGVTEREFDQAFIGILRATGYRRIHFLHGPMEFGKDFIAQKDGIQYTFQTKAGDIGLSDWRPIRYQIDEMIHSEIAHPAFDSAIERCVVLVTTGRLKGGAPVDAQQYEKRVREANITGTAGATMIEFQVWDRETIIDLVTDSPDIGLQSWAAGELADLLGLLSDCDRGQVSHRLIEATTRNWVHGNPARVELASVLVARRLAAAGRLDLAVQTAISLLRFAAVRFENEEADASGTYQLGRSLAVGYLHDMHLSFKPYLETPEDLFRLSPDFGAAIYAVRCSLILQTLGLIGLHHYESGQHEEASTIALELERFIESHPGATHPISDRWANSIIPAATLLYRSESGGVASFLESVATWLCDRYEVGSGLASTSAGPREEIDRLLGSPLEHVELSPRSGSHTATVLLDLACAFSLEGSFRDIRNDFLAVDLATSVLEPIDEPGQLLFHGKTGLRSEANVQYDENQDFTADWRAGVHHRRAPDSYSLQRQGKAWELMAISMLLSDRHFIPCTRQLADCDGRR